MKVFIGWSGKLSETFAGELQEWLTDISQNLVPYVSTDMEIGVFWFTELTNQLNKCHFALICVTQENLRSPWINFEAGILANQFRDQKELVTPILIDLSREEFLNEGGPLTQFQSVEFSQQDMLKLLININNAQKKLSPGAERASEKLNKAFNKSWRDIEEKVKKQIEPRAEKKNKSTPEILTELLSIASINSRLLNDPGKILPISHFKEALIDIEKYSTRLEEHVDGLEAQMGLISKTMFNSSRGDLIVQWSAGYHKFIHHVRDSCLRLLEPGGPYWSPPVNPGEKAKPHPCLENSRASITSLLESMAHIFQLTVPSGTAVWTCLRDRREDDSYHTFARAGLYTPNRVSDSKPLDKNQSKTVLNLKENFAKGSCVMLTGSKRGPEMWDPQPNDKYAEDRCVVMGAVMTKSWVDGEWRDWKLAWILSVCSSGDDVFDERYLPLMQCFVDAFSLLVNIMIRSDPKPNRVA